MLVMASAAQAAAPTIGSPFAGSITRTSATLISQINPQGLATSYHYNYGTVPGIYSTSTPDQSLPAVSTSQTATAPVTGLLAGVTYYAVAVAENIDGTTTSDEFEFSTPAAVAPTIQSLIAAPQNATNGIVSVTFLANGAETTCAVEYVDAANYQTGASNPYALGYTTPCTPAIQDGASTLNASAIIQTVAATSYHVRVTLSNSAGTTQQEGTFTSFINGPEIGALRVENITQSSAAIAGTINTHGGAGSYGISYGGNASYGSGTAPVALTASANPQEFSTALAGLTAGSKVEFKVTASTDGGSTVATGSFTTAAGEPQVFINGKPKPSSSKTKAVFTFNGINVSRYECRFDLEAWKACSSATGVTLTGVAIGDHRFQVRGYNADGVVSQTVPAYWTVEGPSRCVVQVARTRNNISGSKNTINQVIRYKSRKPASVTIQNVIIVGKRTIKLPQAGAHFKRAGMYRNVIHVSPKKMKLVREATSAKVTLQVAGTGSGCDQANSRILNIVKRLVGKAKQLFQSDSQFLRGAGS